MPNKMLHILLVDDDHEDRDFFKELLFENTKQIKVSEAYDGVDGMSFLLKDLKEPVNLPDLIFLDINMPRKNGYEMLEELKENKKLAQIPVVILSSSKSEKDIEKSYSSGASCYVTKPASLKEYKDLTKAIKLFWCSAVKYPNKSLN